MSDISMVSFSASVSQVIPGQEITITCKLKNISGAAIKYWSVGIGIDSREFTNTTAGNFRQEMAYVVGGRVTQESVSWAAGKTKTFVWTVTIPEGAAELFKQYSGRAVPLMIDFITGYSQNSLGGDRYLTDLSIVAVLDAYYAPNIEDFSLVRATGGVIDDEGANVLTTIKLSQADGAANSSAWNPVCMLHYAPVVTGSEVAQIDLTENISALIDGVTNSTEIVQGEISPGNEYQFVLSFGDEYERAVFAFNLTEAFSNFALSETGKGAAFGMFPTSTEEEPKMESAYPGHFYEGIVNFGGGDHCTASQTALGVQSGEVPQITGVSGGAYSDTDVVFPVAFKEGTVPVVVANFRTSSAAAAFGNCACSVHSVTNTGFSIRFYNADTTKRAPGFNWIAAGQKGE